MQLDWKDTSDGKGIWASYGDLSLVVKKTSSHAPHASYWWGVYEDGDSVDRGEARDEGEAIEKAETAAGL